MSKGEGIALVWMQFASICASSERTGSPETKLSEAPIPPGENEAAKARIIASQFFPIFGARKPL